jgi:hypothetical protein
MAFLAFKATGGNNVILFWTRQHQRHYMTKRMWTPVRRTSHSKIMVINMELVRPLQPPLFLEGFPLDVGTLLQGLASIQPQEH